MSTSDDFEYENGHGGKATLFTSTLMTKAIHKGYACAVDKLIPIQSLIFPASCIVKQYILQHIQRLLLSRKTLLDGFKSDGQT